MQIQTLTSPSKEEFSKLIESYKPNLVYLQGEQLGNDEVGPLIWGDADLSTPESVSELFGTTLPTTVRKRLFCTCKVCFAFLCCMHYLFSFANGVSSLHFGSPYPHVTMHILHIEVLILSLCY